MDKETIQTLLDLLNPLHGEIDRQTYDQRVRENFDAPADAEYNVDITARMERDLTQAVCILENRFKAQSTEYAWVIEAGWTEPCEPAYLCGIEGSGDGMVFNWQTDHAQALRFSRQVDAQRIAASLLGADTAWRVAEHAWG